VISYYASWRNTVHVAITGTHSALSYTNIFLMWEKMRQIPRTSNIVSYDGSYDTFFVTGAAINVDSWAARLAKFMGYKVLTILPSDWQTENRYDPYYKDYADHVITLGKGHPEPKRERNTHMASYGHLLMVFARYPEYHPASQYITCFNGYKINLQGKIKPGSANFLFNELTVTPPVELVRFMGLADERAKPYHLVEY
jgi:hypothetical protein